MKFAAALGKLAVNALVLILALLLLPVALVIERCRDGKTV